MVRPLTKYFWVIHLLFIAAAAWLIVFLCVSIIQDRLTGYPKPVPGRSGSPILPGKVEPYERYAIIPDRNIFNPAEKGLKLLPLAGGKTTSGEYGQLAKTVPPGSYRLIGTMTGPGDNSYAIIQDATGRQGIYPMYADVGGAKIVKISRTEIILRRAGSEEILSLSEGKPPARPAVTPAVSAGDVVKKLSPNRFLVNREDVTQAVGNVNQFMTQARIKPHLIAGRPSGFSISEIQPGGLIEKLGLRNNDIIRKVNGQAINKPEEIFQAYSQLQRDGNIEIEVERNDRAEVFRYEVR